MEKEKKTDRRTIYTTTLIKDIFMELLEEKGYEKVTVTEICKRAEINRGTFYLHFKDVRDVLDSILGEIFTETRGVIDHVFCDEERRKNCSYPFCEKIRMFPQYNAIFMDETLTESIMKRVSEVYKESFITYLMQHSTLTFIEAEAIFIFQTNGCLNINRHMLENGITDYKKIQSVIDRFIRAGLESFIDR